MNEIVVVVITIQSGYIIMVRVITPSENTWKADNCVLKKYYTIFSLKNKWLDLAWVVSSGSNTYTADQVFLGSRGDKRLI